MQAEETVEVDRGAFASLAWLWNRDGRSDPVIILFAEGHNDIQSVGRSALEKDDKFFLVRHWRSRHRTLQECGNRAHADHCYAAALYKNAPGNFHGLAPSPPTAIKPNGA